MPHKSVRVFLSPEDMKRVQKVCDAKSCTISHALSKLVRAGAEVLLGSKEVPDGSGARPEAGNHGCLRGWPCGGRGLEMPQFRCLKGYWDFPVEVETSRDAQVIFRCSECAMNDSHCLGMAATPQLKAEKAPSPPFSEEKKESRVVSALELLAQTRPQSIKIIHDASSNKRGSSRNLRGCVAAYYDEILSARNAGHGFPIIAQVMTENGLTINYRTLQGYFNAIWDWEATND